MDFQNRTMIWAVIIVVVVVVIGGCDSYRTTTTDFQQFPVSSSSSSGAVGQLRQKGFLQQQQQQQGCQWSTLNEDSGRQNATASTTTTPLYPPFLQPQLNPSSSKQLLECNVRTLNLDFWANLNISRNQLETTAKLEVRCNDKLYFDSSLDPRQSFFRLRNLQEISFHSCKIRKIPTRIFNSLGFLKSLQISSFNGEWSQSVGMDIETGAFEGLTSLEKLDLSENNIWAIQDRNVFCPLRSLLKLNMSGNKLSDLEELGFGSGSFRSVGDGVNSGGGGGGPFSCGLRIQNLDLSHNSLRRMNHNVFSKLRKLSELRLQNNLIEELEDTAFSGLNQLRLLNISSNRLVALPPSIFKFNPTLREIILSNNSLSALSPQIFTSLTSVVSLDLSRNTLTSQWVRDSIFSGLIRVIVIKLSYNQLSYIDANMFKNQLNLQALHLDHNILETINPAAFEGLRNLHYLDLSHNRLSVIDSRHFSNLFPLRKLYLDHNKIREMDNDCLKNCTSLQDIGLAGNELTEVPIALRGLSHVVTLDIGENKIETITNESFSGMGQLYGLRLVDNKLTELGWNFCHPLPKLRALNVGQNRISKISPTAFSHCPELRALRLDANLLEELPNFLAPQLPSLLWLNASENRLKWADYRLLPTSLEWFDVSHNQLESLGGPAQVPSGSVAFSLRVLDASHNKLRTVDYTTISPTLETLRLNNNQLTSISPDTFSRASGLRRVDLTGNNLQSIPLTTLRFPPVSIGKPVPEFFLGSNPLLCNCENEWLTRVNQLAVLRQYPRVVDLNAIVCRPTFPRYSNVSSPQGSISLLDAQSSTFVCPYKSHCFALCECCEFEYCDCQNICPDGCSCLHDNAWSTNIIECSNSQFKQVPSQIPMDATEIYLDGNDLSSLDSHTFIGKKSLRVLYLNGSRVETLKNKTFNGLKSLEVLLLNDNLLEELNGWEFLNLENLRELFLHNNRLRYIDPSTFTGLTFLSVLRLDGNFLVNYNVWRLSENRYLNSVMLGRNQWSCDCEYLVAFRTWVASKPSIVVDFSTTTCQPSSSGPKDGLLIGSNSTSKNFYGGGVDQSNEDNNEDKVNYEESLSSTPQLIINMCDHDKTVNFNVNPNSNNDEHLLEGEPLFNGNHISAEKVATPEGNILIDSINGNNNNNHNHHFSSSNDIIDDNMSSGRDSASGSSALWTIFVSVVITLLIVLVVIFLLIYRRDPHASSSSLIPFWVYSWCSNDDEEDESEEGAGGYGRSQNIGYIPYLLSCCCGGSGTGSRGKKQRKNGGLDDSDKLFDAYFLYSRKDEDLLTQKIAPELESPVVNYSGNGLLSHVVPPPPPPHHGGGNYHRLCLHYRDLCLSQENPLNSDMVLSACEASKRIVIIISRPFLQNEMSHPGFRSAIQQAINRYNSRLIFILLPPFNEQNLITIYPELKAGHFATLKGGSSSLEGLGPNQIQSLEWADKNFWSKFKLMLPTPVISNSASSPSGLNSTSTISSTGSSALFPHHHHHHHHQQQQQHNSLLNYNNSLSLHEYAYNTINSQSHQYHRNILPFQQLSSSQTPPVPKHHIALSTSAYQQQQQHPHHLQNQNFYNNSQSSQIVPIPGYPPSSVSAGVPLIIPSAFQPNIPSFNESFRRHLQLNQTQSRGGIAAPPPPPPPSHQHHHSNCSSSSHGPLVGGHHHHHPHHNHNHHHHQHQGSHCSSSHSSSTSNNNPSLLPYQPLDANYSSSSSNEELLDHVYSTLDSPPITTSSEESGPQSKPINSMEGNSENNNNSSEPQNRLNTNNSSSNNNNNNNNNCSSSSPSSGSSSNNNNSSVVPTSQQSNNNNNNGTMYFV